MKKVIAAIAAAGLIVSPFIRAGMEKPPAEPEPVEVVELVSVEPIKAPRPTTGPHAENLGTFTCTAYCACPLCCGKATTDPAYGITASGTTVKAGRTVAVDPEVIPLGSILYINGERLIAEDTGGAIEGNRIDIYFDSHDKALEYGVQEWEVWIWRDEE